ncbi:cytochrome c oxidase subunit 3 [Mycolicibacterium sp. P9-22]|uniref:cytochrome c oxidase subunit 3 n=1 Tax=Mycolicibacterium sp. P9-22 TaxID=2024613 RepID=UPI0018836315|nr:cytochrome c oxidase subunit 3 [Mycolicibacterium sp. P9-22]
MFTTLFGAFVVVWSQHAADFRSAADTSITIGVLNTVVLLTSSVAVAGGVHAARAGQLEAARRYVLAAAVLGGLFLAFKAVEYGIEIQHGWTPATNSFWMYYYAITGLHAVHVVMGLGGLVFAIRCLRGPTAYSARAVQYVESSATYWHMVDVLWIVIFPLVYLAAR